MTAQLNEAALSRGPFLFSLFTSKVADKWLASTIRKGYDDSLFIAFREGVTLRSLELRNEPATAHDCLHRRRQRVVYRIW